MRVARKFADSRKLDGVFLIRRWRGTWLEWLGTHWEPMEEEALRGQLYLNLETAEYLVKGEPRAWAPSKGKIANVLDALGAVTYLDSYLQPPSWIRRYDGPAAGQTVAVGNGLLDVRDRRIIEHDPHLFNLASVPFDYDPEAKLPTRWLSFLGELWPDDSESIRALQEWFGYVLSGRTDLHKILLLIGPPRAGKGVIARVLRSLVGARNVAGPTLSSLGSNFGLQPLIGRSLAIVSDARLGTGARADVIVERLLSVSGEDWLTVDRKYQEAWSGQLSARFVVISNELPRLGDTSRAMVNRFVVLTLRNSWLGREDTTLTAQILSELPGILNWSLEGLDSLNDRGYFIEPATSVAAVAHLVSLSSPVSVFVAENCLVDDRYSVHTDHLWEEWKRFCEKSGRRAGTREAFGRDLLAACPLITKRRVRENGKRVHIYNGIGLADAAGSPAVDNGDQSEMSTDVHRDSQALDQEEQEQGRSLTSFERRAQKVVDAFDAEIVDEPWAHGHTRGTG